MKLTGVSFEALLTAFMGGIASMVFVPGGIVPRFLSLVMGMLAAVFVSPLLIALAKVFMPGGGDGLERAVIFLTGFIGMAMLAGIYGVVTRFRDSSARVVDKLIDRLDPSDEGK